LDKNFKEINEIRIGDFNLDFQDIKELSHISNPKPHELESQFYDLFNKLYYLSFENDDTLFKRETQELFLKVDMLCSILYSKDKRFKELLPIILDHSRKIDVLHLFLSKEVFLSIYDIGIYNKKDLLEYFFSYVLFLKTIKNNIIVPFSLMIDLEKDIIPEVSYTKIFFHGPYCKYIQQNDF